MQGHQVLLGIVGGSKKYARWHAAYLLHTHEARCHSVHRLRLVQSLFYGLHVSRQEVVERLWVPHLLTHHTRLPMLCVDTSKVSLCARMSAHTCAHTHTSAFDYHDQADTFVLCFSSHTFLCVVNNSNDQRISVGLEMHDHECDCGGHQDLRLQRRSADLHCMSKRTMKPTHKLKI